MGEDLGKTVDKSNKTLTGKLQLQELTKLNILRHVELRSIWGLLEHCSIKILSPGDKLFALGQANQTMYMILSGKLSVLLDDMDSEPVAYLETGQTVGEISVIDNSPASAHVVAVSPTRLLAVEDETFWRLVEISHEFATNLLYLLTQRMRATNFVISESTRQKRYYEIEAMVDWLTGLHNRRWLDNNITRIVQRHDRDRQPLSILVVDVDHFKRFNDTYGHTAGDQALSAVARLLMKHIRPTDLSARYGGEEFLVILPNTDLATAYIVAERLRSVTAKTSIELYDGFILPPVTISIGIAQLIDGEKPHKFFARADAALYKAKKNGRNRVEG